MRCYGNCPFGIVQLTEFQKRPQDVPLTHASVRHSSSVVLPSSPSQQSDKLVSICSFAVDVFCLCLVEAASNFSNIS